MLATGWQVSFSNLLQIRRAAARALALVAVLCWAASASAAVLVNDTWGDGTDDDPAPPTYSENGVDADTDGDLESAWFQGGGGELNPAGAGGPLVGTVEAGSSSSWTTYFTPEGDEVELANVGDRLKVTWEFTTGDVNVSNGSQNFRIALVDSPGGARVDEDGSPGSAMYSGYGIFGNMGETFAHSGVFELVERSDPASNAALLSSSGAWEDDNLAASGGTDGNSGYTDNTRYTFMMELERNASNGIDIAAMITGGTLDGGAGILSAAATDVDPSSFLFDTFSLRPSSAATTTDQFDTHLFRVEFFPIPEPVTGVLLLLGVFALAVRRR